MLKSRFRRTFFMNRISKTLVAILTLGANTTAFCFSLDDHRIITKTAVDEINQCYDDVITSDMTGSLVDMNLDEDLNVARKWSYASHYYSPEHAIKVGWRKDASFRINELISDYEKSNTEEMRINFIGGMIHYIQDMASPPHVVPVAHGLTDGFEGLETKIPATDHCTAKSPNSIFKIFENTSIVTLASIRTNTIPALIPGINGGSISWSSFWDESSLDPNTLFGNYGEVGNEFGSNLLDYEGMQVFIYDKDYEAAKAKQLRLAVDATKEILINFFIN